MNRFRLSDQAKADICAVWRYIAVANASPVAADRQVDRFFDTFRLLATQPLIGQLRDDLRPGVRLFACDNYVVLYYPSTSSIRIVGVVHGARDIEMMFRQGKR